jgi:AmmeMemoRadiSam system protein A
MPLTDEQKRVLLKIARDSVQAAVTGEATARNDVDPALSERQGAFVTIKTRDGRLRGCIGYPEARYPLHDSVARAAGAAATEDWRFPPVTSAELDEIRLEVSVLSPMEAVEDVNTIEVGRHGLVIEMGGERGLLLPQVAPEYGWDREEFLAHACEKAGLRPDAWRKGAKVYSFTAEVFGEGSSPDDAK